MRSASSGARAISASNSAMRCAASWPSAYAWKSASVKMSEVAAVMARGRSGHLMIRSGEAGSATSRRSFSRARESRDMTVPIGTDSTAAISS